MNVLFVDDQVSVLEGIAAGLHFEELGIQEVHYATGSERAMEILAETHIDLMLCDVEMPGEDGLVLNRRVMEQYPEVVRILLTAHAEFTYAQESIRIGCFDYIVQPAPYEEIENSVRRALQYIYEQKKRRQLYEIGRRMKTNEMELMDRVALNLFSEEPQDADASIELLNLMGYPITKEKKVQILVLTSPQFRKSDTPIIDEKEVHASIFEALKQAGISYPVIPISTVDHRRQFLLVLFSAQQDQIGLALERYRRFFRNLCAAREGDNLQCFLGGTVGCGNAWEELRRIQEHISGRSREDGIIQLRREAEPPYSEHMSADMERWKVLLEAGQKGMLRNEIEMSLSKIEDSVLDKQKALCDLHQQLTHVFFSYLSNHKADVNTLFGAEYRYTDYMGSFTDPDSLRVAVNYMLKQTEALSANSIPISDVEKAKNFITENISEPITVKDVADYVCLNAEYFTKLFKRETGQNIKEYITLTKIEAAKEMLAHSEIPVGMVALEVGYTHFSHFSQVFKKYEDMTPSEYRNKLNGVERTD